MLSSKAQKYLLEEIFCKAYSSKWDMGNKTCFTIAKKIVNIFPSEQLDLYYIPPRATGDDQQHSKGLLPNKFRNAKRTFPVCKNGNKTSENENFEKIVEGNLTYYFKLNYKISLFYIVFSNSFQMYLTLMCGEK